MHADGNPETYTQYTEQHSGSVLGEFPTQERGLKRLGGINKKKKVLAPREKMGKFDCIKIENFCSFKKRKK